MKKNLSKVIALALAAAMSLSLVSCSSSTTTTTTTETPAATTTTTTTTEAAPEAEVEATLEAPSSPYLIQVCGASSGGTFFLLANAMCQTLNTVAPDWFNASPQSTAGSSVNTRMVDSGETDFALIYSGIALQGYTGTGGFDQEYTNLATVTYVLENAMQVLYHKSVTVDTLEDLMVNARFTVGAAGSATEVYSGDLYAALGYDYPNSANEFVAETQAVELMKNRQADGGNMIGALGSANVVDLMTSGDYKMYSFTDEEIAAVLASSDQYFAYTIPAGYYPNQDEDINTYAAAGSLYCNADLDEDMIYMFTKTIYENVDSLIEIHPAAAGIDPENVYNGLTVPFHPGAVRYYEEIGVYVGG